MRRHVLIAASLSVILGAGALVGWTASRSQPARAAVPATAGGALPSSTIINPQRRNIAAVRTLPLGVTVVAQMKGTVPGYFRPGGRRKVLVTRMWQTLPSTLPVIGTAPGGWLHVRLPERPDQSTAWIRSADAVLGTTPYRIVVNLKTTHLQLYKLDRLVLNVPAGVGAADTPTPLGHYFVAFLEPPIGPGYGAFIMITSAHSQVIQSWEGTGDAIVAIHGPIGADAEIGTTGAYISNGCVRLHDNDLLRLEDVSPGTPIDIID
jgi:lipoprotein-anchoring transpeptidase ErfK/SrfK